MSDVKSKDAITEDIVTSMQSDSTEKQTNRTFSQSDVDSMLMKQTKKIEEKYSGYTDMKSQLDTLLNEKKERELSEKTEIERRDIEIKEFQDKLSNLETENRKFKIENIKSQVLSGSKFANLPFAYKNMVIASEHQEEIEKSANDVYEQYLKDFELQKKSDFGKFDVKRLDEERGEAPKNLGQMIKEKWLRRNFINTNNGENYG